MATPKPLEKQILAQQNTAFDILKNITNTKNVESLMYPSALNCDSIYLLQDTQEQEFYLIPKNAMQQCNQAMQTLEREKYLFRLEQEIQRSMPVDFDDVWCIALKEIKNRKKDPKVLVKNLKKRYPYLFLNFLDSFNKPNA